MVRHLVTAMALLVSAGAAAEQREIKADAGKAWKHRTTGITLPATLAGLPRVSIADSTAGEWDVSAQYNDPQIAESVTLYLFHAATPDLPMWFDRAEYALSHRPSYQGAEPFGPAAALPLAGRAGLKRVFVPRHGAYKSAGVAVVAAGQWLVTVRVSSTTLDAAALDARLAALAAEIGWPRPDGSTMTAPVPITACATPLTFTTASPKKADMNTALLGSMFAGVSLAADKTTSTAPAAPLCREGEQTGNYGVYRRVGSDDGYLLALGDAGRTSGVFPITKVPTLPTSDGYSVTLNDVDGVVASYAGFDALPRPEQALGMIMRSAPVTRTSIGKNGKTQININPSALQ